MKEERMEILNMLRDGVISTEEAEKLLSALDDGDRKSKERSDREERYGRRGGHGNSFGSEFFSDFDRGFASFGKAMGEIFGGLSDKGRFHDYEYDGGDRNSVTPDGGEEVHIAHMGRGMFRSGCDIRIEPSPDEAIHVRPSDGRSCDIMRKEGHIALLCGQDCTIELPSGISALSAHLFNGDISVTDIGVPVDLETFNGDIALSGCPQPGLIKTLSGDIEIVVSGEHKGNTDLQTVSGDLDLLIPENFSGIIEAKTISGNIECAVEESAGTERESGDFQTTRTYSLGGGDGSNRISCKTVSGDMEIDHADSE